MSNFFRSMGRSARPKKSPTLPPSDFGSFPQQQYGEGQLQQQQGGGQQGLGSNGKPLYLCNPFVRSALVKGSFKTIVTLPKYVEPREWVAVNCECGVGGRREEGDIGWGCGSIHVASEASKPAYSD